MAEQNPELGYGDIQKGMPQPLQKPPVGLLKQILSRSKDSEQFSPYKKAEPKPIKLKKAPQAPLKPYVQPTEAPIQTDILAPVKEFAKSADTNYNAAIENVIAKKFPEGTAPAMSVDKYRSNLEEGLSSGDFKIVEGEGGYPDIIRTAPSVIGAIADGWNGYFDGIQEGLKAYNPFIPEEDKIKAREYKRQQDALILNEEASKAREYGGLAGSTAAQLVTTFLPIGEAAIGAKVANVAMDAIKVNTVNSALQAITGAISQANQAEDEAYNISRDKGLGEKESYDIAKANRNTYLASGALEGVVSTLADAQIGKVFSATSGKAADGFLNATKAYLNKAKEPAVSLALDGSVAGLMSAVRDLSTEATTGGDLNVMDRAWENVKGELVAGGAIATIASGIGAARNKVDKWYQSQAMNYLSTLDKSFVENELKDRQQKGLITEDNVKEQMDKLEQWNQVKKDNPNIPEEKAPTIVGLILKKKNLTEAFKNADESSQVGIASDIANIDQRIQEAYNNPEPLAGEVDEDGVQILQPKKEENAITTTQEQQQEGPTTSGVSQYQGTEGEQAPQANEADNRNRPISGTQEQVVPESFNTEEGKNAWNTVNKVIEESRKRGRDEAIVKDNAIKNVQLSKAYELADDVTRNKMITDINKQLFGKNAKSAPSVDVLLGNVKNKLDVTEASALKRLFKRQEQASRETAKWIKDTRTSISKGLSQMASKGVIKTSQLNTILKKYDALNLSSSDAIDKFVDYTSKVIENANYDNDINQANSLKESINRYASSKKADATLSPTAKKFLAINPENVSDINEYKKVAQSIVAGLRPTRSVGLGTDFNQPFSTDKVNSYIEKTNADIENSIKEANLSEYQDLVDKGIISSDMPFEDIETIINAIESGEKVEGIKDKERYIRAYASKRFNSLSAFVESTTPKNKEQALKIKQLLNVNINEMPIKDIYQAVNALNNYVTNGETANLDNILSSYRGSKNSKDFATKYPKTISLDANTKAIEKNGLTKFAKESGKLAANAFLDNFSSIPVYFDTIFGYEKSIEFKEKSGFTGIENGTQKAVTDSSIEESNYIKKFEKSNPNGQNFFNQDNVFERGLYADVRRNFGESDKKNQIEFEKRKALNESSINAMLNSSGKEKELGEIYKKIYDKILADSKNIAEVEAKMDAINVKATDEWTNIWNKYYPKLKDVSLNVYNQDLGFHNKYTPRVMKMLKSANVGEIDPLENGSFASFAENIPSKKSGTLMKTKNLNDIPAGKYIDYNFDYNNTIALRKALTDIYTAEHINQLKSFVKSDSYNKIFSSKEQADMSLSKMKNFVSRIRGFDGVDPSDYTKLRSMFNGVNAIVASRSLGSLWAPIKQTVPTLTNTIVNAGISNVNIGDFRDPSVIKFIMNSGRAIANRGIESEGLIESTNKILDRESSGPISKMGNFVVRANKWWLEKLLGNFDRHAAIISYMSYYRQSLKEQGIDTKDINWDTHEINDFAADYAQNMVDVQQNVTDKALAGEFMASRDNTKTFIRNTLMPFGSFNINQKARMMSDIINANSKTNTLEDRKKARRSLYALTAEMTVFSAIKGIQAVTYAVAANALAGVVMSEKEKEDLYQKAIKGVTTNMVNDILSPFPFTDALVDKGINQILNKTVNKDVPQDLKFNLYQGDNKDEFDNLGFTGIAFKKAIRAKEMINEGVTGDITKSYFGNDYIKKIADEDRELANAMAVTNVLSQLGILPADQFPNATMKVIEKKAMNSKEFESYKELRGEGTTEIKGQTLDISKDISKAISIKDPEARAFYLISLANKFGGDKIATTLDSLSDIQTPSGKYPVSTIMDDATIANIEANMSKDPLKIEFGKLFSNKDQKARVYRMMQLRETMSKEDFYATLKWAMSHKLLNDSGIKEFGSSLSKKVGQDSEELNMALGAIEYE